MSNRTRLSASIAAALALTVAGVSVSTSSSATSSNGVEYTVEDTPVGRLENVASLAARGLEAAFTDEYMIYAGTDGKMKRLRLDDLKPAGSFLSTNESPNVFRNTIVSGDKLFSVAEKTERVHVTYSTNEAGDSIPNYHYYYTGTDKIWSLDYKDLGADWVDTGLRLSDTRHGSGLVEISNRVYVLGGVKRDAWEPGDQTLSIVESFNPYDLSTGVKTEDFTLNTISGETEGFAHGGMMFAVKNGSTELFNSSNPLAGFSSYDYSPSPVGSPPSNAWNSAVVTDAQAFIVGDGSGSDVQYLDFNDMSGEWASLRDSSGSGNVAGSSTLSVGAHSGYLYFFDVGGNLKRVKLPGPEITGTVRDTTGHLVPGSSVRIGDRDIVVDAGGIINTAVGKTFIDTLYAVVNSAPRGYATSGTAMWIGQPRPTTLSAAQGSMWVLPESRPVDAMSAAARVSPYFGNDSINASSVSETSATVTSKSGASVTFPIQTINAGALRSLFVNMPSSAKSGHTLNVRVDTAGINKPNLSNVKYTIDGEPVETVNGQVSITVKRD